MSWSWRTKPRSIIKTVHWFPCFAALEGENWDKKSLRVSNIDQKPIHPARRSYIYSAHGEEDAWLSSLSYRDYLQGQKDRKETESNGRNDKTTFEFYGFGYVKGGGEISVSEVGQKIVHGTFDSEDYLKQLLKLRVPNYIYKRKEMKQGKFLFPFKLILRAFEQFESLNRSELALMFGCEDDGQIPAALEAIARFKERYQKLEKKNDTAQVKEIFREVFTQAYGEDDNQPDSYYDYAEALSRTLVYTGLFSLSGRSIASKVRVAESARLKVRMLQEKYEFIYPEEISSLDEYMDWYGSCHNVALPWESASERKNIISDKADLLIRKMEHSDASYQKSASITIDEVNRLVLKASASCDVNDLKEFENQISEAIVSHNEEYFIKVQSRTSEARTAILEKFRDILANDDMSALWLEVNTWKSLIALDGDKVVKRNFKIEDDLTPKSFAPGLGNTPDMELYGKGDGAGKGYVIIPEVSLMTGVRQWEHEGSSVIDHVLSFIKEYQERPVIGLFISSKINVRTMWQFFVLNRESWMGTPVPVIPLTIEQYMAVISFAYSHGRTIDDLKALLETIAEKSGECGNYQIWERCIEANLQAWMLG